MTLPKIKKTNTGNKSKAAARILRALLCFAFWIGIWYIAAATLGKAVILPMPHDVAKRLITLAGTKDFVLTCLRSLGSVFAGIFFGMAFGGVLAVLSHFIPVVKTLAFRSQGDTRGFIYHTPAFPCEQNGGAADSYLAYRDADSLFQCDKRLFLRAA